MNSKKTFTIFLAIIAFFPNSPRLHATLDTAKEVKNTSLNLNTKNNDITPFAPSYEELKMKVLELEKLLKEKDERLERAEEAKKRECNTINRYKNNIVYLKHKHQKAMFSEVEKVKRLEEVLSEAQEKVKKLEERLSEAQEKLNKNNKSFFNFNLW